MTSQCKRCNLNDPSYMEAHADRDPGSLGSFLRRMTSALCQQRAHTSQLKKSPLLARDTEEETTGNRQPKHNSIQNSPPKFKSDPLCLDHPNTGSVCPVQFDVQNFAKHFEHLEQGHLVSLGVQVGQLELPALSTPTDGDIWCDLWA